MMTGNNELKSILANLLRSRVKAEDAPAASDQHWCTAIGKLAKLIPDYAPTDAEEVYELKYALLNQDVLYGRMSVDDAIAELDKYEALARAESFVPPEFWAGYNLKHPLKRFKNNESFA